MGQATRKGNDIRITWSLYDASQQPYNLEGRDIAVQLELASFKIRITDFSVSENAITFTFYGKEQRHYGSYNLVFIENDGKPNMVTFDTKDAFTLVEHSWNALEQGDTPETIQVEVVTLSDELNSNIGPKGDNAGFGTIDAEVDDNVGTPSVDVTTSGPDTAKNIHFSFHNLKGSGGGGGGDVTKEEIIEALGYTPADENAVPSALSELTDDSTHRVVTDAEKSAWSGKQDAINDLATIRSGAAAGATAYQKPGTGIPKEHLASGVQSSLDKADAAAPQSTTYTKTEVDTALSGKANMSEMSVTDGTGSDADKTIIQLKSGTSATVLKTHQDISGKESTSNRLSSWQQTPDNNHYPGEKLVYDSLGKKEDKESVVSVANGSGDTYENGLTVALGNFYAFTNSLGTYTITLPSNSASANGQCSLVLTTGASPAITFAKTTAGDVVYMQSGFQFEANKTYEVNIRVINNAYYIVAVEMEVLS